MIARPTRIARWPAQRKNVREGVKSRACSRCSTRCYYEPPRGQRLAVRCFFCKRVFCDRCAGRHFE